MYEEKEDIIATALLFVGLIASSLIAFIMTGEPAAVFIAFAAYLLITHIMLYEPPLAPLSNESDEWEEIEPYEKD